jgi:hypothetical protein
MIAQRFRRPAGLPACLIVLTIPVLLSGCVSTDPDLGLNVQTNMLAHVIEMDPVYAGVPLEGSNAERQVDAVRRYNKGNVKPLTGDTINKK